MAEAKTEGEDMISELPQHLLVVILGLVPTKDAMATMILSKRWLSIWTMLSKLDYKDADADSDDDDADASEIKKSVWWILDKSMELHEAPIIDRLCVKLGTRRPTDVDVGKWIAKALARLIYMLKFKLLWSAGPTSLPQSLYSCKSLVDLTLSHQILVDVPSSACLPSLKLLDLHCVVYKDEDSVLSFLSSCPVLKHLFVRRRKHDNVKKFTIKVPSLRELSYSNFSSGIDKDTDRCLVLDAPAMTHWSISDSSGDSSYPIQDMPCLEYAHIDVKSYPDDRFLASLSSVLSLCLFLTDTMVMRCCTINFSRLIKLSISPNNGSSDGLKPILLLLGNAPKLQQLLVNYEYAYKPEDLPGSWNQPSSVPVCLSSQLDIFEWRGYGNELEEDAFLTYIFANSKRLKTAIISLRSKINLELQELIIEKLKIFLGFP